MDSAGNRAAALAAAGAVRVVVARVTLEAWRNRLGTVTAVGVCGLAVGSVAWSPRLRAMIHCLRC